MLCNNGSKESSGKEIRTSVDRRFRASPAFSFQLLVLPVDVVGRPICWVAFHRHLWPIDKGIVMRILLIFSALIVAMEAAVEAGSFRRNRRTPSVSATHTPAPMQALKESSVAQSETSTTATKTGDALAEVNAARAKRGLRPFLPDPLLDQAARTCATIRSANRIAGHLSNDFAHLPSGASATSAGCGALEPSWGWGTCCTYENYTYAGAAWMMGADGKRYMHLFVR